MIDAIPTTYAEIEFRSRLEARWAYFFDLLSLEWEYEPERARLLGVYYQPDFLIRNLKHGQVRQPNSKLETHTVRSTVVEIKPRENGQAISLTDDAVQKFLTYARQRPGGLLVLQGLPKDYNGYLLQGRAIIEVLFGIVRGEIVLIPGLVHKRNKRIYLWSHKRKRKQVLDYCFNDPKIQVARAWATSHSFSQAPVRIP